MERQIISYSAMTSSLEAVVHLFAAAEEGLSLSYRKAVARIAKFHADATYTTAKSASGVDGSDPEQSFGLSTSDVTRASAISVKLDQINALMHLWGESISLGDYSYSHIIAAVNSDLDALLNQARASDREVEPQDALLSSGDSTLARYLRDFKTLAEFRGHFCSLLSHIRIISANSTTLSSKSNNFISSEEVAEKIDFHAVLASMSARLDGMRTSVMKFKASRLIFEYTITLGVMELYLGAKDGNNMNTSSSLNRNNSNKKGYSPLKHGETPPANNKMQLYNLIKVIELSQIKIAPLPESSDILPAAKDERLVSVCRSFAVTSDLSFSKWAMLISSHFLDLVSL